MPKVNEEIAASLNGLFGSETDMEPCNSVSQAEPLNMFCY